MPSDTPPVNTPAPKKFRFRLALQIIGDVGDVILSLPDNEIVNLLDQYPDVEVVEFHEGSAPPYRYRAELIRRYADQAQTQAQTCTG